MMRTVFVVGAGGSLEFDRTGIMPVGSGLAVQIEGVLEDELRRRREGSDLGPIGSALARSGGLNDDHYRAMTRIRDGIQSRDSIDQFIDDCSSEPMVAVVAKICISYLILRAESATLISPSSMMADSHPLRSSRDSWLSQILRRANEPISRQKVTDCLNDVAFVTFNYDRCIERYISLWIAHTCGIPLPEGETLAAKIPVVHVYGSLGRPFAPDGVTGIVPFGGGSERYVEHGASKIKTFTEEMMSSELVSLRETVSGAERLVFLGCAYHRQNLRLLLPHGPTGAQIYGTTLGMRPRQTVELTEYFLSSGHFQPQQCGPYIDAIGDDIF